jgi:biotin-dependent carboxylase-like uncharacterized protein
MTTVQDWGRFGFQHLGVPPSGPMDPWSFRLANLAAGNEEGQAVLEATLKGPELRFDRDAVFAIAGADLSASLEGVPVVANVPVSARAGSILAFGERRSGARAYVAVRGGIDSPIVLGSRAASLQAGLPGLAGRPVKAGDVLQICDPGRAGRGKDLSHIQLPPRSVPAVLRFLEGPDIDRFEPAAVSRLTASVYHIAPQSNRMGYRLEGPVIDVREAGGLLSEASPIGSIQVPPSGQPILLMADRQTTGGYPRIGTLITADLPVAGQLAPGEALRFQRCTREEALAALRRQQDLLREAGASW